MRLLSLCQAAALNALTGHTSESGAAPYDRDELTAILAADRAAENAVLAPIETLFRFSPDRSKGQSIIVRKNDDGTYSAVTDPADLINHDAETSESDESDAESTDDDPSDDDHQPPAAPRSSITLKPIIVPAPGRQSTLQTLPRTRRTAHTTKASTVTRKKTSDASYVTRR